MFGLFFVQILIARWKWQKLNKLHRLASAAKHIGDNRRQKRNGARLAVLTFNPLL